MTMRPRSITLRISALFTGLTASVLLAMGSLISVSVAHHFHEQDQAAVQGKLELIQNILAEATAPAIPAKLRDALVGHHELSVLIQQGQTEWFRTAHAGFLESHLRTAVAYRPGDALPWQHWQDDHHAYRGIVVALATAGQPAYRVAIAIDAQSHLTFMRQFRLQLLLVGAVGLVTMTVLGWIVTRRGLLPVSEMARVAEGISAQRLAERLPLPALPVELHSLAVSFNDMLDRLEGALHRLSDYATDIAHELRTPINNLMMQTQVSLSKPRTADQYREILYSSLEECERLARMIADMLFLAKADNGLMVPHRVPVSLQQEMRALFEFYEALAAEKQLQLCVQGEAVLSGDPLMIRRALSNLLSNAIRHAVAGSAVTVQIGQDHHDIRLSMVNMGDDISPAQQERLFDRFYRAEASRVHGDEGAGLGLAITRSIVAAHGGHIQVESSAGRTCFSLVLPAAG